MRLLTMSGHFLLAPIPESSSDYLLPKDIKLAVLGAGRVGKSGEWDKGAQSRPGTTEGPYPQGCRDAGRHPPTPAPPPPPPVPHSPTQSGLLLQQSISELWKGLAPVEAPSRLVHHIPRGRHSAAAGLCPGNLRRGALHAVPLRAQFGPP